MKRILVPIAVVALMIAMVPAASGSAHSIIKGSGVVENEFSGGVFPPGSVGVEGSNADFKDGSAQGKVKFKVLNGGVVLLELQGRVVCYQMTSGVAIGEG